MTSLHHEVSKCDWLNLILLPDSSKSKLGSCPHAWDDPVSHWSLGNIYLISFNWVCACIFRHWCLLSLCAFILRNGLFLWTWSSLIDCINKFWGSLCLCLPSKEVTSTCYYTRLLIWVLEVLNQVFMLAQQAHYWRNHFPALFITLISCAYRHFVLCLYCYMTFSSLKLNIRVYSVTQSHWVFLTSIWNYEYKVHILN